MSESPFVLEESDFVERIVSNLASMDGVSGVEWIQQSPSSLFQEVIRIETSEGTVSRLGLSWVEDEEVEEDYDEAFAQYLLQEAFLEQECSCSPQRQTLKELEVCLNTEVLRFRSNLADSALGHEIARLKKEIAEVDQVEHPPLNEMARNAYPHLDTWVNEQEALAPAGVGFREIVFRFAQEWLAGWRP